MACVCEGLAASTTLSAADEDSDSDFTDEEEVKILHFFLFIKGVQCIQRGCS